MLTPSARMGRADWTMLLALSALWGGSFFFSKIALGELPPLTVVLARVGLAATALLAYLLLTGQPLPRGRAVWTALFGMGFLNNIVPFSLIFWGQSQIDHNVATALAAILNATTPLFGVVVAHWLTPDEKATPGKLLGVAFGLIGVAVMIGPAALGSLTTSVAGELACLGAALSYAFAGIYGRRFRRLGLAPTATAFGQLSASTVMMIPLAGFADRFWTLPLPSGSTIAALAGLALLSTVFAYILFFRLLAAVGATNLLLVTFLIPVSAILLGVLFLHEQLSLFHLAGMSLIGLGLAAIDGRPWGWIAGLKAGRFPFLTVESGGNAGQTADRSIALSAATPPTVPNELAQLNERSREIFRQIVETYLATGEPVGSRNIARLLPTSLSPASVRNVMQDLELLGLVQAPHTSAGRRPTELGLRFFVDAMLEFGDLAANDRAQIDAQIRASSSSKTMESVLTEASTLLSGLSRGAGVVVTTKRDPRLKHIEFVRLEPTQALVVLVSEEGAVENRVIVVPAGLPTSALVEASNYLNARVRGKTLAELEAETRIALEAGRAELDSLTARVVSAGLANWGGSGADLPRQLIVRGQANLLDDLKAVEDLERIRLLFADIEAKNDLIDLLGRAEAGDGVRIFIGSENKLFSLSGSSMIAAPFRDSSQKIVGVLGVIGPTRLNYARVVPMVDYTAKVVGRLLNR